MNEIIVNTAPPYSVYIEEGLLPRLGTELRKLGLDGRPCIVTDSHVGPLYEPIVRRALQDAGYAPITYMIPAGETSKRPAQLLQIINSLAEHRLTRDDMLIALGGGVTGDITGFAAATYMRGLAYVQIPTSLLAMTDSSVGGKTAVNLPTGKNLWGAFKQPAAVFCDPSVLRTLPPDEFINGCGEVVKYSFLDNPELLTLLSQSAVTPDDSRLSDIIALCIRAKARIVADDETEHGRRRLLNLGHTLAHGLEAYSRYTLPHGCAVAIGMALMARLGRRYYGLPEEAYRTLLSLLQAHNLPLTTEAPLDVLWEAVLHDKKSHGRSITVIIPTALGHSEAVTLSHADLKAQLQTVFDDE